ncbi:kinase-like protein [Imleria badia]|nr:kinase-like protein [Imleria badia]
MEVWKRLEHPNILPLYGVVFDFSALPSLVCPWMPNGTLTAYLSSQQDEQDEHEKWSLVSHAPRFHNEGVVHGDLSGSNILIDRCCRARLADFGLSTVLLEFVGKSFFTSSIKGCVRWAAPELFCFEGDSSLRPSCASDMYSFGSIMFQVLTGEIPYSNLRTDVQIIFAVSKGILPQYPPSRLISESQLKFNQECWSTSQADRPTAANACLFVRDQYRGLKP